MSDQTPEPAAAPQQPAAGEECETCIGARAVLLALVFAAFAAYVAADFATGGRVTAAAVRTVAAVRGRAGGAQ